MADIDQVHGPSKHRGRQPRRSSLGAVHPRGRELYEMKVMRAIRNADYRVEHSARGDTGSSLSMRSRIDIISSTKGDSSLTLAFTAVNLVVLASRSGDVQAPVADVLPAARRAIATG